MDDETSERELALEVGELFGAVDTVGGAARAGQTVTDALSGTGVHDCWVDATRNLATAFLGVAGLAQRRGRPPVTLAQLTAWLEVGSDLSDPILAAVVDDGLDCDDDATGLLAADVFGRFHALPSDTAVRDEMYRSAAKAFGLCSDAAHLNNRSVAGLSVPSPDRANEHGTSVWERGVNRATTAVSFVAWALQAELMSGLALVGLARLVQIWGEYGEWDPSCWAVLFWAGALSEAASRVTSRLLWHRRLEGAPGAPLGWAVFYRAWALVLALAALGAPMTPPQRVLCAGGAGLAVALARLGPLRVGWLPGVSELEVR